MSDVVDVKDVRTTKELPEYYVMFPNDLPMALRRIEQIAERLYSRGRRVVRPLKVYRITNQMNYSMLAIQLENISEPAMWVEPPMKKNKYPKTEEPADEVDRSQ